MQVQRRRPRSRPSPCTLDVPGLLHVPRDDRRGGVRAGRRDGVRGGGRDDGRAVGAPTLTTRVSAQRTAARGDDHRQRRGLGTRSPAGDGLGGAPRPVRDDAKRSAATGHLSGRGTFVASGNGTYTTAPVPCSTVPATTRTGSRSSKAPANRAVTDRLRRSRGDDARAREPTGHDAGLGGGGRVRGRCLHDTRSGVAGSAGHERGDRARALRAVRLARSDPMHGRAVLERALHGRRGTASIVRPPFGSSRRRVSTAYRERLVGTALIEGTRGECGATAETSLARPLDRHRWARERTRGRRWRRGRREARTPVRVRIVDARDRRAAHAFGREHRGGVCSTVSDGHSGDPAGGATALRPATQAGSDPDRGSR